MKNRKKNQYTFSLAERKKTSIMRGELDFDNMVNLKL